MSEEIKDEDLTVTEALSENIKDKVSSGNLSPKDLAMLYEKAREADLNEKVVVIESKQKDRENDLKEEEIKQNKIGNWLKFGGTVVTTVIFGFLTLTTQKRDQDFQRDGFGYDNDSSKRSGNVLSNFPKIIK